MAFSSEAHPRTLIREWVGGPRQEDPSNPHLEHGKCDAETYDQRRGAKRHYGKSPLLMLFDIRVHAYLRGKARFVPRRPEPKHRPTPGLLLLGLARLRPAAQTFEGLFGRGFRGRNHVHPGLRTRWSIRLFWHARGITDAHWLRYP